jgi:hypothetical protein
MLREIGRDIGDLADCRIAKNVGSNIVREATTKIWRFEPPPVAELLYMRLSPVLAVKLTNWWLRSNLKREIAGVGIRRRYYSTALDARGPRAVPTPEMCLSIAHPWRRMKSQGGNIGNRRDG